MTNLNQIRRFFAPPTYEDEERQRSASLLNAILNVILGFTVVIALVMTFIDAATFWGDAANVGIILSLTVLMLALRFLMQRGNTRLVSALLSSVLFAASTYAIYSFSGIRNATSGGFLLVVMIAGLLMGGRAALAFTGLGMAAMIGVWYIQVNGLKAFLPLPQKPEAFDVIAYTGLLAIGGLLLRYAADSIVRSLARARHNELAQAQANRELQKLQASLEQQVADRTRDLERRTNYLEATTQVSRAASSTLKVDELTQQVVELIRERFDLYYVGLFLVDGTRQWALLQAGTGQAGQALRARGHVLPVNADSNVGWSILNGRPRVARAGRPGDALSDLDELPDTRSQAMLPLHSRGRVIGALDVHSVQSDAFDATAQAALQGMADQVAVALDNARLFAESQAALEAERRAYGQMGREVWSQLLRAGATPGYGYAGDQVVQIGNDWTPEMEAALREQKSVVTGQAKPALALPIKVRGQTIGVVDLRKDDARSTWTPDEVRLIETLTDQLGVALEGARLFEDAQRTAARERLLNEITARIRAATTLEGVLNSAVREISQVTGASYAAIDLELEQVG